MTDHTLNEKIQELTFQEIFAQPHPLKKIPGHEKENLLIRSLPWVHFQTALLISSFLTKNHISVGSGNGAVEDLLFIDNRSVICVDPNPNYGLSSKIYHPPEFDRVTSLVKAKPEVVGDSSLWMFWPNPACPYCRAKVCSRENPRHHEEYDIEAIDLLQPKTVVLLISIESQTSGSMKLVEWVETRGKSNYVLVFSCNSYAVTEYDMKSYPYILKNDFFFFVRKDLFRESFWMFFDGYSKTFYTEEDYYAIRGSMSPEKLVFTEKEERILREVSNSMIFGGGKLEPSVSSFFVKKSKHVKNLRGKQPSLPLPSSSKQGPSSSIPRRKEKVTEDRGFCFRFD